MRPLKTVLALVAVLAVCMGCASYNAPIKPVVGLFYANFKAPLTGDIANVPVASRRGESSTMYIRDPLLTGLDFAWESAAIEDAARRGGLTKVYYADYEYTNVLGIYGTFKVIAYGE